MISIHLKTEHFDECYVKCKNVKYNLIKLSKINPEMSMQVL